tara:strand:+ start:3996 stop:5120 length:1125 start_codon:yes stop_codon:yes gene_type:complete
MKILLTEYTGLGNSILSSPVITRIKEISPDTKIDIVGDNRFHGLDFHQKSKKIEKIINFKKLNIINKIKFCFEIFNKKYAALIILPASSPSILFLLLVHLFGRMEIIHISAFGSKSNFFKTLLFLIVLKYRCILFTKKNIFIDDLSAQHHEVTHNLFMLRPLFKGIEKCDIKKYRPSFNYIPNDYEILKNHELTKYNYIIIQPYCSSGRKSAKNWSEEKFKKLIEFYEADKIKIVLIGDVKEKFLISDNFLSAFSNLANLAGKTNFFDLCDLLYFSKGVITHESGIMHLSDSMNLKNISIWGLSNPKQVVPFGSNSKVVSKNVSCSPCVKNYFVNDGGGLFSSEEEAYNKCPNKFKCMTSISAEEVYLFSKSFF